MTPLIALFIIGTIFLILIASLSIAGAARMVRSESLSYALVCSGFLGVAGGLFSAGVFANVYSGFAIGVFVLMAVYNLTLYFLKLLNKMRPQREVV